MNMDVEDQKPGPTDHQRSLAEWISLGISSSILAVIVGLVGYTWLQDDQSPPLLELETPEDVRESQGKFYVPFELKNSGGQTAESVKVLAELRINNKIEETGEQEFDFLSSGETEEGAFIFSQDPRRGDLSLRITGYKLP